MKYKKIIFIFGTRPEAIKLFPLWYKLKTSNNLRDVRICLTGQHHEMLDQVIKFFNITPDYDLKLMSQDQSLFKVTAEGIRKIERVLEESQPDIIFVQGDTTSAFIGALAGFYKKIKIAHVEAGLRTNMKYSPFPEEINRILVDHLSDYHFAPTEIARKNLIKENIDKNVWTVGNTGIDALFFAIQRIKENKNIEDEIVNYFMLKLGDRETLFGKRIIFVTAHRRENFGVPFYDMCNALKEIAQQFPDLQIIYPVHLNPNVRRPVFEILNEIKNIHLLDPLNYPQTVWLMQKSYLILTDSGGIQEEAPSLGKPVLIMREVTERVEGIEAGTAILVGSNKKRIIEKVCLLIKNTEAYEAMSRKVNPYGDGNSCKRIVKIIDS